jgi:hypothetical protein
MYRGATCALALLALLTFPVAGARAFDESKYPSWKGQWVAIGGANPAWDPSLPAGSGERALLTPEYQAVLAATIKAAAEGGPPVDPTTRCVPAGMPRVMMSALPMEIVITPPTTYITFPTFDSLRHIWTDGRGFATYTEPSFIGTSIGHWQDTDGDGRFDTLAIETRAIRGPHTYDASGMPFHRDGEAVVTEKIYADKMDANVLHDEITTDDHALMRPWTVTRSYRRNAADVHPDWNETICRQDTSRVLIGDQYYKVGPDGLLMPAAEGQPRPDLKYFK